MPTPRMSEPTRLLYLDYDGVCHFDAVVRDAKHGVQMTEPGHELFEWAPHLVEALLPFPDVRIVLSTSWVPVIGFSEAKRWLPQALQARVFGATYHSKIAPTPYLSRQAFLSDPRGIQVMADVRRRKPRWWIALDDTDEGWPLEVREHLVLCDPMRGLSEPAVLAKLRALLSDQ